MTDYEVRTHDADVILFFSTLRVDIKMLRELVSVVPYESLADAAIRPDGILYARSIGSGKEEVRVDNNLIASKSRLDRIRRFQRATGYKV